MGAYDQWSFLVPLIGGRYHTIPQLAVYTTYIYIAYWVTIYHLQYHLLREPFETAIGDPLPPGDFLDTWKVEAMAASSCQQVKEEIRARVDPKSGWHDPHNGGAGWRLGRLGEAVKVSGPSKETNSKFG